MVNEYTLSLALVDFVPIIFTGLGMYFVTRMVNHLGTRPGQMAMIGAVLIVAGGVLKAVWKTIIAVTQGVLDIDWMENSLFVFMAPGFILLAYSVWSAVRARRGRKVTYLWPIPAIVIGVMLAASAYLGFTQPDESAWKRILLGMMVLANLVSSILLILFAFREKKPIIAVLFILNYIGVLVLNGLARVPEQTITLQWIEEGINAVTWLLFSFAAFRLYEFTREKFGVD